MFIFTIFDSVSKKPGNVFTTATIGEAERQFHDALGNAQVGSLFRTHPQDFSLHLLGEFDEKEMKITKTEASQICTGKAPIPTEGLA